MATQAGTSTAEEIARAHFEALGRQDLDATRWSEDVIAEITSQGVFRGREEITQFFVELFAAVPDAELVVDRINGGDGVASVEWHMHGTFDGETPFRGIEPTGAWLEIRGCDVAEVEGEEITRITAYADGMEIARAMGMMPPLESAGERAMIQAFNLATKARRALRERFG